MSREFWIEHREAGQRMIDVANIVLQGFDYDDEIPVELMGERPVIADSEEIEEER